MRVTFKDVGQGDSIVIEWDYDGTPKMGIVDCRRYKGVNPVLEHVSGLKTKELSFVFLTHPHKDHFSGMLELLAFCESNDIKIKRFVHTLRADRRWIESLKSSVGGEKDYRQLVFLLHKVDALLKKGIIRIAAHAEIDWSIPLNSEWTLRSHAPSEQELANYHLRVAGFKEYDADKSQRAANLLSAILTITSTGTNSKAILTSDAEVEVFDRLCNRNEEVFDGQLLLAQIPHHGSIHNHHFAFWSRFEKVFGCPAIISVGENEKYKHPDRQVVHDFQVLGFEVYSTNDVNGFKQYKQDNVDESLSSNLDAVSFLLDHDITGRDLSFHLNANHATAITIVE